MNSAGLHSRLGAVWAPRAPWWKLSGLCVTANLAETGLVMGFDHGTRPDLAPQASALAPFAVFSDLRWVSVYHYSWSLFVLEIVAMLLVRGAIVSASVALTWPANVSRPGAGSLYARGVTATALAALFLAPSVTLLFGLAAVPVSWLFLAAVPAAVLVAFIVHPLGIAGDWWRRTLRMRAIAWVAASFVVLSLSTAVMSAVPEGVWPIVAVLSGVFNAWSWWGVVHAVADRRPQARVVPMVPLALLVLVGGVIGGTILGFSHAHPKPAGVGIGPPSGPPPQRAQPVLVVSGYGSTWDGASRHPIPGDFYEEQFSYAGLDRRGRPLRYRSSDTVKPLDRMEQMLIAQVRELSKDSGKKVDLVAESEGALVAKTALLADPHQPVKSLVIASPLVAPGRVSFPPAQGEGWGVASAEGMKLLGKAFQSFSPISLDPDSRFLESLDREAPALETAMSCAVPGVRQFALLPLADATVTPSGSRLPFPTLVVDSFHGGLLESPSVDRIVSQLLRNKPLHTDGLMQFVDDVVRSASGAWQVPSLVLSDYPAGSRVLEEGVSAPSCSRVEADLREQIQR
jgi:hypothetical protein